MRDWRVIWLALTGLALGGCATQGRPRVSPNAATEQKSQVVVTNVAPVTVITNVPKPELHIRTAQKWNPVWWFGNADEPEPPAWYKPDDPKRVAKWHRRNPLHNFTFYVIGVADKPFTRKGRHPQAVFNPESGWNSAVCRYRWWRLPFLSYTRGRFAFYCGWRERGNFGFKLNFKRPPPKPEVAPEKEVKPATD